MEEPQSRPRLHATDCRETRIIGKIRESLLSLASAFNPSVIDRHIHELFNSFNTPTHPPYALMIQTAVLELNDGNGSTEEAISEFIQKKFENLPWAHTRILGLHLRKLCQAEELYCTDSGRYMLMVDCDNFVEKKENGWRGSKRRKRCTEGRNHMGGEISKTPEMIEVTETSNGLQEHENEEQNQLSVLHGTRTNELIEKQENSETGLLGMTEECHGRVAQAQSEAEKPQNKSMDERIQEAIMELNDKIGSGETMNTEPYVAIEQHSKVIEKHIQCEEQPYDLLAVAENLTLTQQIDVTAEISRFFSDEHSNDGNLSALLGPTIAVIPKENLQILEQEEQQHQNVAPCIQQIFSNACEFLVDQEDPISHLETTSSSQATELDLPLDVPSSFLNLTAPGSTEALEYTPSAGIELPPTRLQLQMSKCGLSVTDLCAACKMPASLSYMTVREHKQPQALIQESCKGRLDENTTFGDLEKHMPKPCCGKQSNLKPVADYPVEPSDGGLLKMQKLKNDKIQKQQQLQPSGQGRGRGRGRFPKLDGNPHKHEEPLELQDQALVPVSFPNLKRKRRIHSSQPASNLTAVVTPNHHQHLGDPISEGTSGCISSTNGEISPIQLQLQMSWQRLIDRELGATPKVEASLSSLNVYEDKPQQQGNKRGPKRKLGLGEKTAFGHLEQQPNKCRRRGRPSNPKPVEDYSGVSLLPSDDGIHNEQNPNFYNIVKQRQLQPRERGRGRGRGRPPKLNLIENHCQLLPQDQAQGQVPSPSLPDYNNQNWEQKQLKLRTRAQTQKRPPNLESGVDRSCQKQLFLPQSSSQGPGKRELQQLKLLNAHQSHRQLQLETCQGQVRGLLRSGSTKPSSDAS